MSRVHRRRGEEYFIELYPGMRTSSSDQAEEKKGFDVIFRRVKKVALAFLTESRQGMKRSAAGIHSNFSRLLRLLFLLSHLHFFLLFLAEVEPTGK